jgi:hypothetical protein
MRAIPARILALLAALVLLLPGGASARTQYYCQMMGRVVASCCCETEAVSQAPRTPQQLRSADCCQRISASRSASLGTREVVPSVPTQALLATLPAPLRPKAQTEARGTCAEVTQAPLAIGPPLFVAHCALLS